MNRRQKKERLKRVNMSQDELAAENRRKEDALRAVIAKSKRRAEVKARWAARQAGRELRAQNAPKTFTGEW